MSSAVGTVAGLGAGRTGVQIPARDENIHTDCGEFFPGDKAAEA